MAKLGQFFLSEQLLGEGKLQDPLRPISRMRIPLGATVRRSLSGFSFPKTGKYKKEITYRIHNGHQMRYQYRVTHIPSSPNYDAIWQTFREAVALWQTMTTEERAPFNLRADALNTLSGYNLFIRDYINPNA